MIYLPTADVKETSTVRPPQKASPSLKASPPGEGLLDSIKAGRATSLPAAGGGVKGKRSVCRGRRRTQAFTPRTFVGYHKRTRILIAVLSIDKKHKPGGRQSPSRLCCCREKCSNPHKALTIPSASGYQAFDAPGTNCQRWHTAYRSR